jgi:hypothetical protein
MNFPSPAPAMKPLAQSGVAVSHTGDTTEFTFVTVTIPGGMMGPNGRVEVEAFWTAGANNANAKTTRVRFGGASGTAFEGISLASNLTGQFHTSIANRGATNSQTGHASGNLGYGLATGARVDAAVDTTADVNLLLTGTLGVGTDTLTLESYTVRVYPK